MKVDCFRNQPCASAPLKQLAVGTLIVTAVALLVIFSVQPQAKGALWAVGSIGSVVSIALFSLGCIPSKKSESLLSQVKVSFSQPADPTSLLEDFYLNGGKNTEGRTFKQILNFSNDELESVHDYIQWLFPSEEMSSYNSQAPLLTKEICKKFQDNDIARENAKKAFLKMLNFYGLHYDNQCVKRAENWKIRSKNWLSKNNHNHLRITRILKFLISMNLVFEASAFFEQLRQIKEEDPLGENISDTSFNIWEDAVKIESLE